VLSLVRSNPQREVGFLAEYRRLNVAMTRAKRQLVSLRNQRGKIVEELSLSHSVSSEILERSEREVLI
jgi:superfamily I DNA and/or RNA helicase